VNTHARVSACRTGQSPVRASWHHSSLLTAAFIATAIFFCLTPAPVLAQSSTSSDSAKVKQEAPPAKWFDKINLRGYAQLRYNRLLETNPDLKCEQCDKSWGDNGGFFLRRVRLIFSGNLTKHIYFYIQPDFASSSGNGLHYGQIRDAYFDIGFDKKNEFRVRLGQSKVPFGFENLQSSSNRLPLDRDDALNSGVANERDLGGFFYWAPAETRKLLSSLVKDGLKGSGDYGVFGFGVYNGQTANVSEQNDNLHMVARLSWPLRIGKQIIEPGIQGYTGKYVVTNVSTGTKVVADRNYTDQRFAASFVLYPQPFGFQAEYNIGKGPEFNTATDSIETRSLQGGYAILSYMHHLGKQTIIPFFRYQYYDGGKKHELDARSYTVHEAEIGVEWQPVKAFELVAMYTISKRRFEDFRTPDNTQEGNLLRLQAQINF